MAPIIERIGNECYILGESPHWDLETQSYYFVDIFGKSIHRYTPGTQQQAKVQLDKVVSFIIPVEGRKNQFLIALEREIAIITWDGQSDRISNYTKVIEIEQSLKTRINDGKADPKGRLWAGTMGLESEGKIEPHNGTLYSLNCNRKLKAHASSISISNGLAWNTHLKKFYYIDSPERKVFQYDFNSEEGEITNQETIFTFDKHNIPGAPDGLTIDTDGNLWVAVFNGSRIIKIDPRVPETLLETIEIPAKQVTCVVFGGKNLDELFVTTASITMDGEELKPPHHGALYRITGTGAKGNCGVKVKM